jgi:hypothetical protein
MQCGASVTCAPLRRRRMACFSRACPYAAALLCQLGPLLQFRKSASGCCQPPPAGGPLAAELSNCTRRASRQHPARPGRTVSLTRCRGAHWLRESTHCPGPARRSAGPAARCAAAAGLQPAKRAAGGLEPTPGRCCCCGLGPRASPSHRTGDWARIPARAPVPVCSLPIHRLRTSCGSFMLRY